MDANDQPLSPEEIKRRAMAAMQKNFAVTVKPPPLAGRKRIRLVGILGVVLIAGSAGFLYFRLSGRSADPKPRPTDPAATAIPAAAIRNVVEPEAAPDVVLMEGASWPIAEKLRQAHNYPEALSHYRGLLRLSDKNPAAQRISGLLHLRVAECLEKLNRMRETRKEYIEAAEAASPAVRAVACYELARLDVSDDQFLMGRMRAYQALACAGALGQAAPLTVNSEFLAAQAVTYRAISFYDNEMPRPRRLPAAVDPFAGLDETRLYGLVETDVDRLSATVLGPQFQKKEVRGQPRLWTALSAGSAIEDVVSRLGTVANLEIRWDSVDAAARRRGVVLDLGGIGDQALIEVICGSVGLVARFTGAEIVICDPVASPSTSVPRDLAVREAVALWRRFFLRASDNGQLAAGHFLLASLYERTGEAGSALTEFHLVTSRFASDPLAPTAQLHRASVQIELRDYTGARKELLDLLNHYPDCQASDEVYLRLGQATLEAGMLDEALATFKKLYFMDLSLPSKAGASLGAGKGCYRKKQYNEAATWLTRRLAMPRGPEIDRDLPETYSLLAQTETARGNLPQAVGAYKQALVLAPHDPWRAEILLELVRILIQQEDFVAAMGMLNGLTPKEATPQQADEITLVKAEILVAMQLPEQAITLLKRALPACSNPSARTRLTIQLARAMAGGDDPEGARQTLSELLPSIEPGPLAHRASLDLADLCLKTNHNTEAIAVCQELLKTSCSSDIRRGAMAILGQAYAREKDYQRAAMALSGMPTTTPEKKQP